MHMYAHMYTHAQIDAHICINIYADLARICSVHTYIHTCTTRHTSVHVENTHAYVSSRYLQCTYVHMQKCIYICMPFYMRAYVVTDNPAHLEYICSVHTCTCRIHACPSPIQTCTCSIHLCIYIYIYIYIERERKSDAYSCTYLFI